MIIESVSIASFGRLHDQEYRFGDGLNIIEGGNETGKSTLAAFIRYMLYGFPRASGSELGEKRKRISWQDASATGSMTVRVGNKRYRIERSTVASTGAGGRETYRETSAVIDLETNIAVLGCNVPGEFILHVPEEIFENTAFIGQVGSPRVGDGMAEAIENLLFSGDENLNAKRAIDKLDQLRRTLLYKNGKGGELYDLQAQEQELTEHLSIARDASAEILAEETELEENRHRLEDVSRELAAVTAEEREARYIVLAEAFSRLHEAEHELSEAENALRDMEGMPAYLLRDEDVGELRACRSATAAAAERLRTAADQRMALEEGEAVSEADRELLERAEREGGTEALLLRHRAARRSRLGGRVLAILALILTLGGGALTLLEPAFLTGSLVFIPAAVWVIAALLAVAGLALAIPARLRLHALHAAYGATGTAEFADRLQTIASARDGLAERRNAITAARMQENALTTEYNRSLGELDTVVSRFGYRLPEDGVLSFTDQLLSDAARVLNRKKEFENTRLSAAATVEQLRLHLEGSREEDILAALPPEDRRPRASQVDPDALRERITFYQGQERELLERGRTLESHLAAARARTEDPAELTVQLEATRQAIARAREKYEACVMAQEAISGAGERLRRDISPRLGGYTGQMLNCLTDGRYEAVGVAHDLAVSVNVGENVGTRALDYLSTGTQDITYVSLRMALIDLLYREEKPPVCFDESFAHQDDRRAARMMELLLLLARQGQQSFVFTCHSREFELASRLNPTVTSRITMTL